MVDDTRRPFWRSPTIRRHAAGLGTLAIFAVVWGSMSTGDPDALLFATLGLVVAMAAAAAVVAGLDTLARRRVGAAFQAAHSDPRNRTGPSITIWPEPADGRMVAFVEYDDGTVDDLAIDNADATFHAIVELLYRLADAQVQIGTHTIGAGGALKSTLAIRFPPSWGSTGVVKFPPASIDRRDAERAAREAAFRASIGEGPPTATD